MESQTSDLVIDKLKITFRNRILFLWIFICQGSHELVNIFFLIFLIL